MDGVSGRHVGLVIGSQDAFALDFWVWVDPDHFLQLDDVVSVSLELPGLEAPVHIHGIVDTVRARYEGARFDSDALAARDQVLPLGVANAAHVTVTRVEPEIFVAPAPGTEVVKSEGASRNEALYFDKMLAEGTQFCAGFSRDGEIVWGNREFLDGTRGAHMNISGVSGVATKTSYALFLLHSLFASDSLGALTSESKAIIFNVKGEDLLWLDRPNRKLSSYPRAAGDYAAAGLPAEPFRQVAFWAPPKRESFELIPECKRKDGVTAFAWSLEDFCRERLLRFLFAEADSETSQLPAVIRQVEDILADPAKVLGPAPGTGFMTVDPPYAAETETIGSFHDLVDVIAKNTTAWAPYAAEGTRSAFVRRLFDAQSTCGHLIRAIPSDRAARSRLQPHDSTGPAGNKQVHVIDINGLPDRAKRFVVGVVVRRLVEHKERGAREPLVFLVLDELNKYAPREGWSPIKEVILDIAERGRSLGVILIGAQQTASEVERRVTANASFRVAGRLDTAEAGRAEYGFLTDAARARAAILKPGTMFIHQPEIPVPLLVQFPFPAWATREEEVNLKATLEESGRKVLR
jgi:DNA helicase HerA-like ATPase